MKARTKSIYMTGVLLLIIIVTLLYFFVLKEDSKQVYEGTFVRKGIQSAEDMIHQL